MHLRRLGGAQPRTGRGKAFRPFARRHYWNAFLIIFFSLEFRNADPPPLPSLPSPSLPFHSRPLSSPRAAPPLPSLLMRYSRGTHVYWGTDGVLTGYSRCTPGVLTGTHGVLTGGTPRLAQSRGPSRTTSRGRTSCCGSTWRASCPSSCACGTYRPPDWEYSLGTTGYPHGVL